MLRTGLFRRRKSQSEVKKQTVDNSTEVADQERSRTIVDKLPSIYEDVADFRQPAEPISPRRTFDSSSSVKDIYEKQKASAVSRALWKNWTGVDDEDEERITRVIPSMSPFYRAYIEHRDYEISQSSRQSETESTPPIPNNKNSAVLVESKVTAFKIWNTVSVFVFLLGVFLCLLSWRTTFCALTSQSEFCHTLSSETRMMPTLPFRDRYFKVIIYDDSTERFGTNFEEGLNDAAKVLRVNVTIERSSDNNEMVKNVEEASNSLFDGMIVTLTENSKLMDVLRVSKHKTSIITTGPLETYLKGQHEGIGHLGEQEANVGRLAAEKMKNAGMKISLCLSRADNIASVLRCKGFKESFNGQTYELNLNTMLQSELKSKLIPTILDDEEINGLFVADSRSFSLVHQILKSLNRLCSNKRQSSKGRCIYFGTYGTDSIILKAVQKKEIQFTIDPQEYLHGYLSVALLMLASYGYPEPIFDKNSVFQLAKMVDSAEQALAASVTSYDRQQLASNLRFKVFIFGSSTPDYIQQLKAGLRNAARDLNVHVEFEYISTSLDMTKPSLFQSSKSIDSSGVWFDGYAFSTSKLLDQTSFLYFNRISDSGHPFITFGKHHSQYDNSRSLLHLDSFRLKHMKNCEGSNIDDAEPRLHGYLSVLFLALNKWYGQVPFGSFSTSQASNCC